MPVNQDIYKAVVRLTYTFGLNERKSLGSGVIFGPSGLVLTNNHVIEDGNFGTAYGQITAELLDSADRVPSEVVSAELLIRNELNDLAIIQLQGGTPRSFIDVVSAPPADASLIERRIRVLGYPPLGGDSITVTRGIGSGFDGSGNLKTDAEINPGNSGGAALDDSDVFLGIPSFINVDTQGKLGFVISVNKIKNWFQDILKSGLPKSTHELASAFANSNLNFSDDNLGQDNKHPRIIAKFAAVESLLASHDYENVLPQVAYILEKRPRSALAYRYRGDALLVLKQYLEAANEYRNALVYAPYDITTLGNYGVTLIHLGRQKLYRFSRQLAKQALMLPSFRHPISS